MARTLRILPSVFAVAVGVAPPVVVPPPVQPASLPVAGVATQTLATIPELASGMPSAGATAPQAPRMSVQPFGTSMSEADFVNVLSDSRVSPQALPNTDVWSTAAQQASAAQLVTGASGLPEQHAASTLAVSLMKFLGVFLFGFVSAAGGRHWWSLRQGASDAMQSSVAALELSKMPSLTTAFSSVASISPLRDETILPAVEHVAGRITDATDHTISVEQRRLAVASYAGEENAGEEKVTIRASTAMPILFQQGNQSAFSENVWYEAPGVFKNGPRSLGDYWRDRPTRIIERIDDGKKICGCTWKQLDGRRGASFMRLDSDGRVMYMREVCEPPNWAKFSDNSFQALSPAFGLMNGIRNVLNINSGYLQTDEFVEPTPKRGLAKPRSRRARDVVEYLWEEAQYSKEPLDPVERIITEYAEDAVYEDLTYKDAAWPKSRDAIRSFQQEIRDSSPDNLVFVLDEISDGERACTALWHIEFAGQRKPRGVSFYGLDETGKIDYVRMAYNLNW